MNIKNKSVFLLLSIFMLINCKSKNEQVAKLPKTVNLESSFKIGVVADCQYCNCDVAGDRFYKKSADRLRKAVAILNNHTLNYAVHLGDFIDQDFESYDAVVPVWNSLKSKKYHVLGNHDFSVTDSLKPLIFEKMNLQERYYSIVKNKWRFIMLDGNDLSFHGALTETTKQQTDSLFKHLSGQDRPNLKDWNGGLSMKQLNWVKDELKLATKQNENVGFYCHFPALGEKQDHNLWNYEQLLTIIDGYECVKFYFNGHNHAGGYVQKNGVHYLNFKGMVDTKDSTSFAVVTFKKDSLFVQGFGRELSRGLKLK